MIHWIDNTSALAGLIRGYAGSIDSARIVHAFHALNVAMPVLRAHAAEEGGERSDSSCWRPSRTPRNLRTRPGGFDFDGASGKPARSCTRCRTTWPESRAKEGSTVG